MNIILLEECLMDLLEKVISDDIEGIDSKELAKLYDYDLFTLGDVADSLR